jgi:hypothetical protein
VFLVAREQLSCVLDAALAQAQLGEAGKREHTHGALTGTERLDGKPELLIGLRPAAGRRPSAGEIEGVKAVVREHGYELLI